MTKISSIIEDIESKEDDSRILCNWVRDYDEDSVTPLPIINMRRYYELLSRVPDKVAENMEKARLARDGRMPMLKAGGGSYEELLSTIILDGPTVGSSAAEAKLLPTIKINGNYMQPQGAPTRTLALRARGRATTLTTAATMTVRVRIATTDIITGNIVMQTGALTMDTVAQTNSQWELRGEIVVRTVGTAGTVQGQGRTEMAASALTIANQQNSYMGSGGALAPASQTWDMTVDQYFQVTAQWSLATAYAMTCHNYILESLN